MFDVLTESSANPALRAATSIGGASLYEKDGRVILADVYDFSRVKSSNKDWYAKLRGWFGDNDGNVDKPTKVELDLGSIDDFSDVRIVKAGDTLAKIAKQHGMSVEQLASANGISDVNRIRVGQKILVKPAIRKYKDSWYSDFLARREASSRMDNG